MILGHCDVVVAFTFVSLCAYEDGAFAASRFANGVADFETHSTSGEFRSLAIKVPTHFEFVELDEKDVRGDCARLVC